LETHHGKPDEPYAVRVVLGWSTRAPVVDRVGEDPSIHLISLCSLPTTPVDDFNLKRFWEIEQIPVKEPSLYTQKEKSKYHRFLWPTNKDKLPDTYHLIVSSLEIRPCRF
jgi:hypothetical protein